MKEKLKKLKLIKFILEKKYNHLIKREYIQEYKLFMKYYKKENLEKKAYRMLLNIHALEKGMTNLNPRPFGVEKISSLIYLIDSSIKENNNVERTFAIDLAISILYAYMDFYEKNGWSNKEEYLQVKEFLKKYNKNTNISAGVYKINKKDFIDDANINYYKFLKSRHSVRNYKPVSLKEDDIQKAVQMARLTPSSCNRQMCKIWHIKDSKKVELLKKFFSGIGNFELTDFTSFFVITFDMDNFLFASDRTEGYFNAGLIAMNFVNALHSLGIGSCFLQFGKFIFQEEELKKQLEIPSNHRITIGLAAGYYDDISNVPYSSRRNIDEIYFVK